MFKSRLVCTDIGLESFDLSRSQEILNNIEKTQNVILLNVNLPDSKGIETLNHVRLFRHFARARHTTTTMTTLCARRETISINPMSCRR